MKNPTQSTEWWVSFGVNSQFTNFGGFTVDYKQLFSPHKKLFNHSPYLLLATCFPFSFRKPFSPPQNLKPLPLSVLYVSSDKAPRCPWTAQSGLIQRKTEIKKEKKKKINELNKFHTDRGKIVMQVQIFHLLFFSAPSVSIISIRAAQRSDPHWLNHQCLSRPRINWNNYQYVKIS